MTGRQKQSVVVAETKEGNDIILLLGAVIEGSYIYIDQIGSDNQR